MTIRSLKFGSVTFIPTPQSTVLKKLTNHSVSLVISREIPGSHGGGVKMIAFLDIAPCSVVETDKRSRDAYCFHHQDDDEGSTL
jgi:hypothetical protein